VAARIVYGEEGLVMVTPKEDATLVGQCCQRAYQFFAGETRYVDKRDWESTFSKMDGAFERIDA